MGAEVVSINKKEVVALEVAEAEFERFIDAMDLAPSAFKQDDGNIEIYESAKKTIIDAIMRGHLTVDSEGQVVFTPQVGDTSPMTFYEPTGKSKMMGDYTKEGHNFKRMYTMIAQLTKQDGIARFEQMKQRDLVVVEAMFALFFARR